MQLDGGVDSLLLLLLARLTLKFDSALGVSRLHVLLAGQLS